MAIKPIMAAIKTTYGNKSKLWTGLANCYGKKGDLASAIYATCEALKTCQPDEKDSLEEQLKKLEKRWKKIQDLKETEKLILEDK